MWHVLLVGCVALAGAVEPPVHVISLGSFQWTVTNGTQVYPATVPGQIHTDLLAAGVIDDPYVDFNVDNYKWIAMSNWTYSATFSIDPSYFTNSIMQLVSDGLDTIATLTLNGKSVIKSTNMYQRHRVNVKELLKSTNNVIVVQFTSKVLAAGATAAACSPESSGSCPKQCPPPVQDGFCDVNFIRTEPCSFSWDWGPAFAPVGVWRPLNIEVYNSAVIREVLYDAEPFSAENPVEEVIVSTSEDDHLIKTAFRRTDGLYDYTQWVVKFRVYLDGGAAENTYWQPQSQGKATMLGMISISMPDLPVPVVINTSAEAAVGEEVVVSLAVNISQIQAWYPNGFGGQTLYTVIVSWIPDGNANASSTTTFSAGFRKVELIQDPLPGGKSFHFRANGIPIPVHGSNFIPTDAFESRVNSSNTYQFFRAMLHSHQNMIRIWGGGIYQHDYMYNWADQTGVMVWQDMMWACNKYAIPPEYLRSAASEVQYNIRRIQRHPSVVIWAGNNENEYLYIPHTKGAEQYGELYFTTILNNVTAIDTTRPTVGSSPSCGDETEQEPVCADPNNVWNGDTHLYLYGVDCWEPANYLRPRFTSEFGLQSWPGFVTMKQYLNPSQWNWTSAAIANRNHHPDGQSQITQQIEQHYRTPEGLKTLTESHMTSQRVPRGPDGKLFEFASWLYLSQVYQAYCYKTEVEFFRSIRQDCSATKSGCNMGQMYWQTNDIWPGASWSAIDYTGRYKMLQYFTKNFYSAFLVGAYFSKGKFVSYALNDDPLVTYSGRLEILGQGWTGGVLGRVNSTYTSPPATSVFTYGTTTADLLEALNCGATECVVVVRAFSEDGTKLSENYVFPASLSDVTTMQNPQLAISGCFFVSDGVFSCTLTFSSTAAFVWLETPLVGTFVDNGYFLYTEDGKPGSISFLWETFDESITAPILQASLDAYSIYDTANY